MKIQAIALCVALATPFVATADSTTTPTTAKDSKPAKLVDSEVKVLAHIHHVNQSEIDMGKLAQKMGSAAGVKTYGAMLVKDHGDNDRDLLAFAKKHDQKIPAETAQTEADKQDMKDQKDAMARLMKTKGADFDREFLRMMVDGHDKELAKVDTELGQVNDGELSQMLKDMKPVLQRHSDQARDLQKSDASAMK